MCEQAKHSSEAYYLASEELYHSQMVTEFESSVLKEIYFSLHLEQHTIDESPSEMEVAEEPVKAIRSISFAAIET
jgi:hypothetical protein